MTYLYMTIPLKYLIHNNHISNQIIFNAKYYFKTIKFVMLP